MITKTIALLGSAGTDKITGFSGVITSVGFDLYGCVQVVLTPRNVAEGKLETGHWFDVNRVEVTGEKVMVAPDFAARGGEPSEYDRGPAQKPAMASLPTR